MVGGGLKSNIDQMGKGQIMDRYGTKQDGTGWGARELELVAVAEIKYSVCPRHFKRSREI